MNSRTRAQNPSKKGAQEITLQAEDDGDGGSMKVSGPVERHLTKAREFNGDLRKLPKTPPVKKERPELEGPEFEALFIGPPPPTPFKPSAPIQPAAPAPTPAIQFDGLDFNTWGAGHPPDTVGDVGPNHYVQAVNTSIGIYNKGTGAQITAFTFDTFMSQGSFGNLCDTDNFGDPVVVYDTFEDRWIITDFAFTINGQGQIPSPPGAFQCFAVSKTGDPVVGGWNFYFIQIPDLLNDYPKFGIWPDGLYMNSNMFGIGGLSAGFAFSRQWVFNKAQMYAGAASPQIVTFDAPRVDQNAGAVVTIIPSNARLQVGTPIPGTPNYFIGTSTYTNALAIWRFHVDWSNVFLSTFTGVTTPIAGTAWASPPATVPSLGGNNLDTLATRSMMQNQYTNFAGVESLWISHTVRGSSATQSAVRWYQQDVSGGTIAPNIAQAATHSPDTTNRFMPSLALDRAGNMMIGYSASSSTMKPAIRYAGRLVGDPIETLPQTEVDLIQGTGTQVGSCGGTCTRWGDYAAMSLDPVDGCTFWFTSEYYATDGLNDLTRIGSFKFPSCTAIGNGTVSGTVTVNPGGAPISGATITFGSRTTTTAVNGTYSFTNIPAGTYSGIVASAQGFNSATSPLVMVPNGGTSTNNFGLTAAPTSGCFTDTTQADFSIGTPSKIDLTTSAGDVRIQKQNLDALQASFGGSGVGITTTTWGGQTFTPSVTGQLTRADINLFCSTCTGTIPNLTLSVQATSGGLPTGPDLASTTIPGFASGAAIFYTGTFATPATLTSGTQYALVIRPTVNPSLGTYALTRTGSGGATPVGEDLYAGGVRVSGASSGTVWTAPLTSGISTDAAFRTFMTTGAGTLVSSVKDNNPAVGNFPHWSNISWNASTPANTTLQFQVAASNSPTGPFNFVGPDGTAATFYTTSPGSLLQFNTKRYLKYKAFLSSTDPAATPNVSDVTICFSSSPTAATGSINGVISTANGTPVAGVVVDLGGSMSATAITDINGAYRFGDLDTNNIYTVTPALPNYHFSPANRSFSLAGNRTDAVFTAEPDATASANAIDSNGFFVRQQYLDFLGREPEAAGFAFWTGKLNACGDAACLRAARIEVSAAFFKSQEFYETGSFVYRLYRGALGRRVNFGEFSADRAQVVGGPNLEQTKRAFAEAFVARSEFTSRYQDSSNAESFVDALLQTMRQETGVDLNSQRSALLTRYQDGNSVNQSRALVVRDLIDQQSFGDAVYNSSFVEMEYVGYLRRGGEPSGYNFWLGVMNTTNDYRGMVCSFLTSTEYQHRFGSLATHSNTECGQ
jgi:hypothetical protein